MLNKYPLVVLISSLGILSGSCNWLDCLPGAGGDYEKTTGPQEFLLLTYNVAGLPEGISSSHPRTNIPQISPMLNQFDIVLVQEDFSYHLCLTSQTGHPYESEPSSVQSLGDGLNRLSYADFYGFERVAWNECYGDCSDGSDCLTLKGFSVGTHELIEGVFIDIYNLHMDAGGADGDIAARESQADQLLEYIKTRSVGNAVIAAGDWNLKGSREADMVVLDRILAEGELMDSCRALSCGEERIDRVLFRSNDSILVTPQIYNVEIDTFTDEDGEPLSDHDAVSVLFGWELL
jgi:hypothetical protein